MDYKKGSIKKKKAMLISMKGYLNDEDKRYRIWGPTQILSDVIQTWVTINKNNNNNNKSTV
jgi:hypothetical protein